MKRLALLALIAFTTPASAQDRAASLADIRAEIAVLSGEIAGLRAELSASEGAAGGAPAEGGALARLDAIERELRRLTARTEELEFRIRRIVEDGTNRIDDLRFRLTELEGGDPMRLPETPSLGGEAALPDSLPEPESAPELAVGEAADFEAAVAQAQTGAPAEAVAALDQFLASYPESPFAAEAHLFRGRALERLGQPREAGRAYLTSYTRAETSAPGLAAEALAALGSTLAGLGQTEEACLTLAQVPARFPGTTGARSAETVLAGITCP